LIERALYRVPLITGAQIEQLTEAA
jgi:hypothetical protein